MVYNARRVLVVMLLLMLAGNALLMNPPESVRDDPDLRPWSDNSLLKPVLDTLCLHYKLPTPTGLDVKSLVFRAGTTLLAVFALLSWGLSVRRRPDDADTAAERDVLLGDSAAERLRLGRPIAWRHPGLLGWAMGLLACFVAWTSLAVLWAHAPDYAVTWPQQFGFLAVLAILVGVTLNRGQVRTAAWCWLPLACVMAVLAIWYHHERAPHWQASLLTSDAKELAGVLTPGLVLVAMLVIERLARLIRPGEAGDRGAACVASLIALVGMGVLLAWCVWLCGRGVAAGVLIAAGVGVLTAAVLMARRRRRVYAALLLLALVNLAIFASALAPAVEFVLPDAVSADPTAAPPPGFPDRPLVESGRWEFARELWSESPWLGQGGWSYRLRADQLAAERAKTDPTWANTAVGRGGSFWLETLVDFGVVGVALLLAAVALLLSAAGRAASVSPWRRHRYLIAALAGGLVAMLVFQLFASSVTRHVFPAVLATWAGLTVAATRWANRRLPEHRDEYRWTFYPGGLTFLAGAAMAFAAVGYLVAHDWQASRDLYKAAVVREREADRAETDFEQTLARLLSPTSARGDDRQAERLSQQQQVGDLLRRLEDLRNERAELAEHVVRYSMEPDYRFAASLVQADATVQAVRAAVTRESAMRRAIHLRGPEFARQMKPLETTTSGAWSQWLKSANDQLGQLAKAHPAHPRGIEETMARTQVLILRGRAMSDPASDIIQVEIIRALRAAARLLDAHIASRPTDLRAVLWRLSMDEPFALSRSLMLPVGRCFQLIAEAGIAVEPARRLEMLAAALRDNGLIGAQARSWLTMSGHLVGRPALWALPGLFYDELARLERLLPPVAWSKLDAGAAEVEARLGQMSTIEGGPGGLDAEAQQAAGSLRLLAERELLRNFILGGDGLVPLGTPLASADAFLKRAWDTYEFGGRAFATQRIIVALQRAQIAWTRYGAGSDEPFARLAEAQRALLDVDRSHYAAARRAVSAVATFLHTEAGQSSRAVRWVRRADLLGTGTTEQYRERVADEWSAWLRPRPPLRSGIKPSPWAELLSAPLRPDADPDEDRSLWPVRVPTLRQLVPALWLRPARPMRPPGPARTRPDDAGRGGP